MNKIMPRFFLLVALFTTTVFTHAASLTLQYTGDEPVSENFITTQVGTVLTFDVIADFTDFATIGGGFDIVFDSDKLQFDGFTNAELGDPLFSRDPLIFDGLLSSWTFGTFALISDVRLVGTVMFTVVDGVVAGPGNVATRETMGPAPPFMDFFLDTVIPVDYNAYQVGVVPVPAAVWLFVSGCALFGGLRRRA